MGNKASKSRNSDLGNFVDSSYDDMIPFRVTLVNSYRLEQPVWVENSSYSVTKAFHLKTKKSLVLKKIAITDESTKQLTNLLAIYRKINHLNIKLLDEVFQTKTHYYVVHQYFNGYPLFEYLSKQINNITMVKVRKIFKELLEVLNYLHHHNILLRNLDPSNILFNGETVMLIGLSKARFFINTKKKTQNGTKYVANFSGVVYKAPEVINHDYDLKADIWVVGVLMHLLLTGDLPFMAPNTDKLNEAILQTPLDVENLKKKRLNQHVIKLITGMLEKDPEKRITINEALTSDWFSSANESLGRKESVEMMKNIGKTDRNFTIVDFLADFISKKAYMDDEIKNLKILFKQIDKNNDGSITKDEMQYAVESIGLVMTDDDITLIFSKYDTNKSGQLEFTEFVAAFMQRSSLNEQKKLEEFFEFLDADQSGLIDFEELELALGSHYSNAQDKALYNKYAGRDRKLNKTEFVAFILDLMQNSKINVKKDESLSKNTRIKRAKTIK